jgi:hypothetical protein
MIRRLVAGAFPASIVAQTGTAASRETTAEGNVQVEVVGPLLPDKRSVGLKETGSLLGGI